MEQNKEETIQNKKQKNTKKIINKRRNIIVPIVLVITIIISYILFRGSYLEYMEIGEQYIDSFWKNTQYVTIAFLVNFLIIYLMIYFTNKKIKKNLEIFFKEEKKEMVKLPNKSIAFISAIVISGITTNFLLNKAMLFFNSTLFGTNDPILGHDIGYYMFQKPFIELIIWYFLISIIALTIYGIFYYIITFNICFNGINMKTLKTSKVINQLTTHIMIASILISGLVFLNTQSLSNQSFLSLQENQERYNLIGAGITDVTLKLWGYRILCIIIIASVFAAIKSFNKRKTKNVLISISIVPAYLFAFLIVMIGYNVIFINSNELDKEKKYIQNNINYTRSAYGINIEENYIENEGAITKEQTDMVADLINNIPIASKDVVLKDLQGSQTSKGYYSYHNTQIAKYKINEKDKLVYLSPREIKSSGSTYNNKTYEYTHGFGAIVTSASSIDVNGNLEHIQKSFTNTNEVISIEEPRIYFGLETNDTVVTNSTDKKEFDYPVLDSKVIENKENIYDGNAGLSLNFLDRFILSIKEGDLKLALSGNVNKNSKILTNRNIIERAKRIMPYLTYDENPYLVVNSKGKMVWVLDAYTMSNEYPYSQKTTINANSVNKKEFNYIRNSVKVLVDSYDGTINFYITDKTDPIVMAYKKMYKNLFCEEEIPDDIKEHLIYPEFLYNIQANILARYHNITPDVLYRSDDVWTIASHNTGKVLTKAGTSMKAYYTMVKLSNEENMKLGLVLPYTPNGKQNINGYLVGSCNEDGNLNLTLYKFPSDSNVLGPMQLDTQIEQDEQITKQIDSLNVNGTKLTKNMIVVPINNTLLYVETIYQQSLNEGETALPTLKKVIVASGNKLAIGNDFKEALNNLVSQNAVDFELELTDNVDDLIETIIKANKNLEKSTNSKDWEMMGKDVKKLQELIDKLEVIQEEENKKKEEENKKEAETSKIKESVNENVNNTNTVQQR